MAVTDRLFGERLVTLALFPNTDLPGDVNLGAYFSNAISVFTSCRLSITDTDYDGRATSEVWEYPLPAYSSWTIETGAVVDNAEYSFVGVRLISGRGPFWAWMVNSNNLSVYGRCLITDPSLSIEDVQSQSVTFKGRGKLSIGALGV